MKKLNKAHFVVEPEYTVNVFARYRVIIHHISRKFLPLFFPLLLFVSCNWVVDPDWMVEMAKGVSPVKRPLYLIWPFLGIPLTILWPYFIYMYSSEKSFTKKRFFGEAKREKVIEGRDARICMSIIGRTYYRYRASLEMNEKEMIFEDKVTGLINGELGAYEKYPDSDIIRFELRYEQITAMWISRDFIVMRFCWGTNYTTAWDFIIDRSKFVKGDDKEFVQYMIRKLKGRRVTYDIFKFADSNWKKTLGNYSTNLYGSIFTQHKVKIYHNFWGPFKKSKKQEKDEEQLSEEEAK